MPLLMISHSCNFGDVRYCHTEILSLLDALSHRSTAASLTEDYRCRFCNCEKEDMNHLTKNCMHFPDDIQKPQIDDEFGPNFRNFGIVETPIEIVLNSLKSTSISSIPVVIWNEQTNATMCNVWTDGSVENPKDDFFRCGGFSIVDSSGNILDSGPVQHWNLCAYTTELWAIIVAYSSASQPICIHSDCQSVVDQMNFVIQHNEVPFTWTHISWWLFFLNIFRPRQNICKNSLEVRWCKAHLCDHLPDSCVTPQTAFKLGVSFADLVGNRIADKAAKAAAKKQRQIDPDDYQKQVQRIIEWQIWLAKLNAWIGQEQPETGTKSKRHAKPANGDEHTKHVSPHEICVQHHIDHFKALLPRWTWQANLNDYPWKPCCPLIDRPKTQASITLENWQKLFGWLRQQNWRISDDQQTSWIELAVSCLFAGVKLEGVPNTPRIYAQQLMKIVNQIHKLDTIKIVPGSVIKKCKSNGKTHPMGCIDQCEIFFPDEPKKYLAAKMLRGCDHHLNKWDFCL